MKSLILRFSLLVALLGFGVVFYLSPQLASASPQYCGNGSFACGDLSQNGTCCRTDSDKCCYVSPSRGSCYCVLRTDKCDRY